MQSIKTRLTQNLKAKHTSNAYTKTRRERERKVIESLRAIFLPHPGRTFPLIKSFNRRWEGIIKIIQVWKEHEGFEKISKRSKRWLKLILASRCYHVVALLSGKPLIAIWSSMIGNSTMMTEMLLLLFRLLRVSLLSPRIFSSRIFSFLLILLSGCS